ncbi:protein kinase [Candidatus Sumerlaeota bacterium]|nr:protein kinase [Candidatus Sumerlaeota bacterium]
MKPSDRYTLVRLLGAGGMGEVYLAEDALLKRTVAVKKVRPSSLGDPALADRITRECVLHAKVGSHPNIVSLYDRIDVDDEIMLVMEYVPGKPLRNHLEEMKQGLSLREAVDVTLQTLSALEAVHNLDIIHRDIKPENIMVMEKSGGGLQAKLLDFGIARGGGALSITSTAQSSPGTPKYMAPEQIDPESFGRVSQATDVYAVGIMLFELISGSTPFHGNLHEILAGHLHRNIPAPQTKDGRAIPKELQAIIQKATARQSTDRYPTAREFLEALRNFATKLSIPFSVTESATQPHGPTGEATIAVSLPPDVIASTGPGHRNNPTPRPPQQGNPTPFQMQNTTPYPPMGNQIPQPYPQGQYPPNQTPYPPQGQTPYPYQGAQYPPQAPPGTQPPYYGPPGQNQTPNWNPTPPIAVPAAAVQGNKKNIIIIALIALFVCAVVIAGVVYVALSNRKKDMQPTNNNQGAVPLVTPTPTTAPEPSPIAATQIPATQAPQPTAVPATSAPPPTAVPATQAPATAAPTQARPTASTIPTAQQTTQPTASSAPSADGKMIDDILRLQKLQTSVERTYKEKSFDVTRSDNYNRGKQALAKAQALAREGKVAEARTMLNTADQELTKAQEEAKTLSW